MNIFTRIKNQFMHSYYFKLSEHASNEAKKHINDADDREFMKWMIISLDNLKKAAEIKLKLLEH